MTEVVFYLNDTLVRTEVNPATTLLDYVRYDEDLPGTKIGCREGDCGACTMLVGKVEDNTLRYQNITSCITPIANVHGKHVVTVEGINLDNNLTLPQQLLVDEGGTQCGFCTVGFIVSLTGFCLNYPEKQDILAAISGNICRCTGYKSIERAATQLKDILVKNIHQINDIDQLIDINVIPSYFGNILEKLQELQGQIDPLDIDMSSNKKLIAGGTDLYVQQHDVLLDLPVQFIGQSGNQSYIRKDGDIIIIGGNTTATEFMEHPIITNYLPNIANHFELIASQPIRNIATMAGNIVNASPIGDFTNIFLALNAVLHLKRKETTRSVSLKKFYSGYKQIDLEDDEYIHEISFQAQPNIKLNFEKVSKRTYLDIASVNSSIVISHDNYKIKHVSIAAGGVAPYPILLTETCKYLLGQEITTETVVNAARLAQDEISPISDIRGSAEYKRLLLRQLIVAHFIQLFPHKMGNVLEVLV